jgi:hypothetical protein
MKRKLLAIVTGIVILFTTMGCASNCPECPSEATYFKSSLELMEWLGVHKDLQTSEYTSIFEDYAQSRELQKQALADGYIISVYVMNEFDVYGEPVNNFWVLCDAYLENGDVYYWSMMDFSTLEYAGNW